MGFRKVWRVIKRELIKLHNDEGGVIDWALPIAAAVTATGSALSAGGGKDGKMARYPREKNVQHLLHEMIAKYPQLKGLELPGIAPEATDLISRLMTGQLPTGVSQALGGGAERAYGAQLSGLSDIGAGPATLAGMRGDIMGRLGEQKAMLGWQGMQAGLQAVPQISELMMQPQKWGAAQQRARWTDIANLFAQHPTGAYLTGGQHLPTPGGGTYSQY